MSRSFNHNQINYNENIFETSNIVPQTHSQSNIYNNNAPQKRSYHEAMHPTYQPAYIQSTPQIPLGPQLVSNSSITHNQNIIFYNNNNNNNNNNNQVLQQDSSYITKRRKTSQNGSYISTTSKQQSPLKKKKNKKISNPQHNRVTRSFKGSDWDPTYSGDDMRILPREANNNDFDYHLIYYIKEDKFEALQNETDFCGQSCSLRKSLNESGCIDLTFYFSNSTEKTYQNETSEYFVGICDNKQKDTAFNSDPYYWHPNQFPGTKQSPNNSWKSGVWGLFNDGVILKNGKLEEEAKWNPSLGKLRKLAIRVDYDFTNDKNRIVTFKYFNDKTKAFDDVLPPKNRGYTFQLSSESDAKFYLMVSLYDRTDHVKVERHDSIYTFTDRSSSED